MTINYLLCENQNFIRRKSKQSNEHLAEKLKKLRPWCRFDSLIYQPSDKRSCCAAQTSSTSCLCHSLVSLSVSFPPSPPEMCQAAQAGGHLSDKAWTSGSTCENKAQTPFPSSHSLSLIYWVPLLAFQHTSWLGIGRLSRAQKRGRRRWLRSSGLRSR